MHQKKELSDKISELFRISREEFKPKVHFGVADDLVAALTFDEHVFSLSDALEISAGSYHYEAQLDRIGDYVIKSRGKFFMDSSLGWHPKIEVAYWKNRFFWDHSGDKLWVAYQGKQSIGIIRGYTEVHSFSLPLGFASLHFNLILSKESWSYQK